MNTHTHSLDWLQWTRWLSQWAAIHCSSLWGGVASTDPPHPSCQLPEWAQAQFWPMTKERSTREHGESFWEKLPHFSEKALKGGCSGHRCHLDRTPESTAALLPSAWGKSQHEAELRGKSPILWQSWSSTINQLTLQTVFLLNPFYKIISTLFKPVWV